MNGEYLTNFNYVTDKALVSWFPVETTLENVFGEWTGAEGVTMMEKNGEKSCHVSDSVFDIPLNYKKVGQYLPHIFNIYCFLCYL